MVYIIMICMTVPLLLLMTMLDNKSRLLLGFVLCGMVLAVCAYEINSLVCYSLQLSGPELSITAAPVIEEILKALPVLFFAVLVSDERKQQTSDFPHSGQSGRRRCICKRNHLRTDE